MYAYIFYAFFIFCIKLEYFYNIVTILSAPKMFLPLISLSAWLNCVCASKTESCLFYHFQTKISRHLKTSCKSNKLSSVTNAVPRFDVSYWTKNYSTPPSSDVLVATLISLHWFTVSTWSFVRKSQDGIFTTLSMRIPYIHIRT